MHLLIKCHGSENLECKELALADKSGAPLDEASSKNAKSAAQSKTGGKKAKGSKQSQVSNDDTRGRSGKGNATGA